MAVIVHTREDWQARNAGGRTVIATPSLCAIHHTAGSRPTTLGGAEDQMRSMQNQYIDGRGYIDLGYTVCWCRLGADVHVYLVRLNVISVASWQPLQGAHTEGFNLTAVAICAMANYAEEQATVQDVADYAAVAALLIDRGALGPTPTFRGHRDFAGNSTDCPSSMTPLVGQIAPALVTTGGALMALTDAEQELLAAKVNDLHALLLGETKAGLQAAFGSANEAHESFMGVGRVPGSWRAPDAQGKGGLPYFWDWLARSLQVEGVIDVNEDAIVAGLKPVIASVVAALVSDNHITEQQIEAALKNVLKTGTG